MNKKQLEKCYQSDMWPFTLNNDYHRIHMYIYIYIYEMQSYMTFNMDNSKRSIHKKTFCCVFLNKREVLSRFIGKSNIFKYFSPCQTRSHDF